MNQQVLVGLTCVVALGIAAQWSAWRLGVPSILFLLAFGLTAGPVTGFLHPDQLFGDMLFPFISLSVSVILFEGGLSLKLRELRTIGADLVQLTTVGVLISWLVAGVAARLLLGFDWASAALLGAILTVTGPTVIGPLLRHLRPRRPCRRGFSVGKVL